MLKGKPKTINKDLFCAGCNIICTVPRYGKCEKEQRILKNIVERWNNKENQVRLDELRIKI